MTKNLFKIGVLGLALTGLNFSAHAECTAPESHLTIIGTNDIHGGIEAKTDKKMNKVGGTAFFTGAVRAIRKATKDKYGECGGVLTLDGGDQFQGTLISNYNEGSIVFDVLNVAQYDAVVPGNHDYDFGPLGWLKDKAEKSEDDPREVIKALSKRAKFPLLSANTYFKETVTDLGGEKLEVENVGCKPKDATKSASFFKALRPDFLKPYIIKEVAGLKVAIIGLDNAETPKVTTIENVDDLCFRSPLDTYLEIRKELDQKADVFVIVIHDGDGSEKSLSTLMQNISSTDVNALGIKGSVLDAVVGGHTHFVNKLNIAGIPGIQSGSGGTMFGRIDLTVIRETGSKSLENEFAGVRMLHNDCDPQAKTFCEVKETKPFYDQNEVHPSVLVDMKINKARELISQMADRHLGTATKKLWRDRILESPLADFTTDTLRNLTGTDIAFMNTGGIREDIDPGDISYETFYTVLPFGNHGVVMNDVKFETIMKLLNRSVRTCGSYGALMQSGLRIEFTRDCKANKETGVDLNAKILKVTTASGELLFDDLKEVTVSDTRTFKVATLDFLASGGAGYDDFKGHKIAQDIGIVREAMADFLEKNPANLDGKTDGRWKQIP